MGRTDRGTPGRRYKSGRDALTEEEVAKLLLACRTMEEDTLLSLAISVGIRREDIVALERNDVRVMDQEHGVPLLVISFWEKKKRRDWVVHVGGKTAKKVLQYIESKPKKRWVFPGHHHDGRKHLAGRTAYNILQRVLERAGLRHRPFHALRATCMKMCRGRGLSIEQTMELTGDSWRTVQEHYLTPSEDEMLEVARKKAFP